MKNVLAPFLFVAVLALFGLPTAQAQVVCAGFTPCFGGGTGQIEVVNNTNCAYTLEIKYRLGGSEFGQTCLIPHKTTQYVCFNVSTTMLLSANATMAGSSMGADVSAPSYPGTEYAPVAGGGCDGSDHLKWVNFIPAPAPGPNAIILIGS